jgi:hypothetical protein
MFTNAIYFLNIRGIIRKTDIVVHISKISKIVNGVF